ncbi:hypothetical protein NUW58_g1262 [Xylaria curta]|uniref:Uncharacterized protein n=1 Tax=Xylaria curta TaxID=42375 RepID=A0ACC1PL16_9PEZI|nr:hypothetical protein NUW58_g1262 [Xylaria curta]
MPPALRLPIELLYYVSECLGGPADLSSWSRSCRALHAVLTPLLYRLVKDDPAVMCWACDEGRLGTVQRLLDAGADPNAAWSQEEPRWWTLRNLNHLPPIQRQPEEDITLYPIQSLLGGGFSSSPSEERRSSSPQSEEDHLFLLDRHPLKLRVDVHRWLLSHAALDHEVTEYFDEDFYNVDDDAVTKAGLWEVEGDMELETWPWRYGWNLYTSVGTFPQRCYWTPLHIAAAWGNDKLVDLLLDNGAEVNALSRLFCVCAVPLDRTVAPLWTPLHTSMCHGHESTTRLLLSRGASTNVTTRRLGRDKRRFTALHSACAADLLDAAQALVDGGHQPDVTVRDQTKLTPFAHAFFLGNWAMIDFLVEHGADINAKIGPLDALGHACLLGYYAEALRFLDLGATPQCEYGMSGEGPVYIHLTAVAGAPHFPSPRSSKQIKFRLELVNRLIKHGVDVNQRGVDGTTALMEAASFHRLDVVKALLRSGADVRTSDRELFGMGALEKAVSLYSEESQETPKGAMLNTVKALLESMAENPAPRLVDEEAMILGEGSDAIESDTTDDFDIAHAFRMACTLSHKHEDKLEVVTLLLRYKRAVELANREPNLVYASILGTNFDISNLLLENGFNRPCRKQFDDLIRQFVRNDIVEGLRHILNCFPDIAPRIRKSERLYDAIDAGSEECAEFLINEGISVNSSNEDGRSLLFAACMMGDTHTAELLLKNGADPDEYTQEGHPLTTVAALDHNEDMVRLLLDYGASIHSTPLGKPAPHHNLGFFDFAISCGLEDAVGVIINHKNYGSPTDEEISTHWRTLIHAPSWTHPDDILTILLDSDRFDKDQIFASTEGDPRHIIATPLHLCCAIGLVVDKTEFIEFLLYAGADIHKRLPVRPDSRIHESRLGGKAEIGFEGTTPLEWAIEWSSITVVRALLLGTLDFDQKLDPESEDTMVTEMDIILYTKAACRRQKAAMLSLLFKKALPPTICDEDGNTAVHMLCDFVETFWPNDEPEWTMEFIAKRWADSLLVCLKWGVEYEQRNKKGVSGMDRVLEILKQSDTSELHRTLAEEWHERIDYVEDSSPRLTAKWAAVDDSDVEDELLDDEDLNGGLDTDSEMTGATPSLLHDS